MTLEMLPNDLILNCLARVSRLYYPTLALVSKSFRSLVVSLELYQTRTFLGCNESCLYVKLFSCYERTPRWFTLSLRPTPPRHDPKPSCLGSWFRPYRTKKPSYVLVPIQTHNASADVRSNLVAVGCNFYKVGLNGLFSSRVMFMNCWFHTWSEAPRMNMARSNPYVSVFNGKIYVVGGNKDCDSSNWIEFFDPKTQSWENLPSPDADICRYSLFQSLVIKGKLYLFVDNSHRRVVCLDDKENKWDEVQLQDVPFTRSPPSSCVIDNVLYYCAWNGKIQWYDFEGRFWKLLKGLKGLPKLRHISDARFVDYGGKMAILWESIGKEEPCKKKKIWLAEISLKRSEKRKIFGKVEWCGVVLTVPMSWSTKQFFAVSV